MARSSARLVRGVGVGLAASALVAAGVFAATASAVAPVTGSLLQHGPGSVFMGSQTFASEVGTAGATVSYAVKIKNTGAAAAQYVMFVYPIYDVNGNNASKLTMFQGGLNGLLGKTSRPRRPPMPGTRRRRSSRARSWPSR